MSETYKREIPIYQLVMQYAYEAQGHKGKNGEITFNPMTRFVSIHDAYTPGGLPLRVDIDHVARRAEVAKTGSYWDLNETEKPTANALVLATPSGALTYVLPSEFATFIHNHDERYYTQAQVTTYLAGKSNTGHNHDERYYTETEIDWLLGFKSNDGHNHDERYYTESEIDSMFSGIESLWTDAGGGEYRTDAVMLHMNNPSYQHKIRFSDAGANIHELHVDYNTGFKMLSGGHNFEFNSATGLLTTDSINAGGISYPTAPPASDKLILVSASGATSYIDVPTGGSIGVDTTGTYIPVWNDIEERFKSSPFSVAAPDWVVAYNTQLTVYNDNLTAIHGRNNSTASNKPGIRGEGLGSCTGGIFSSETGTALIVSNGGANITGATIINGITYPAADGSAGQFMQTDGAGNITFATIGTGITGTYNFASYTGITVQAGRITSIF